MSAELAATPPPGPSVRAIVARLRAEHRSLQQERDRALRRASSLQFQVDELRKAANLAHAALGMLALPDGWRDLTQAQAYAKTARDDHAALVPAVTE